MKLDVKVFRSRSILVDSGHLESPAIVREHTAMWAIVLKHTAMYSGLRCQYWVSSCLHFFRQFHHWDCVSESVILGILLSSFLSTVPSLGLRLRERNSDRCIRFPLTIEPLPFAIEISIARGSRHN